MKRYATLFVVIWTVKMFWTFDGVCEFLNTLPPIVAKEAKVACTDTNGRCAVFYPEGF